MHKALSLAPSCSRRACSPVFLVPFPASFSSLTISALSPTQPPYFIEASTPSSTGSSERSKQCVSLARECFCQDVSQNLYRWGCEEVRRSHPGRGGRSSRESEDETEEWAMWRRPGRFSRRVSPVTFHYRLITSEYSFRVSPCLLAYP